MLVGEARNVYVKKPLIKQPFAGIELLRHTAAVHILVLFIGIEKFDFYV
jgi:hypothetical protein